MGHFGGSFTTAVNPPDLTPLCTCPVTSGPHRSAWLSHSIRGQGHPGSRRMAPPTHTHTAQPVDKALAFPIGSSLSTTGASVFKWKPVFRLHSQSEKTPGPHSSLTALPSTTASRCSWPTGDRHTGPNTADPGRSVGVMTSRAREKGGR